MASGAYYGFKENAASPDLLLSSAFAEQRPLVPVGEENNLLNNTLWDLFFSNELKLLVLPSPLGFLSPGNGGTEGGVKTIEEGERLLSLASRLWGCFTFHSNLII